MATLICVSVKASPVYRTNLYSEMDPSEAMVQVTWSGWSVRLTGDGWIGFVAPEPRDDLEHTAIDMAEAVELMNRLLEMGFFYMPETYPSISESLTINSNGTLYPAKQSVSGEGRVAIRLKIGPRMHRVFIETPIATAPEELVVWFSDFEELVAKEFFRND
jgi:hypothetical protein